MMSAIEAGSEEVERETGDIGVNVVGNVHW